MKRVSALLAALFFLVLTGCGGGGENGASTRVTTTSDGTGSVSVQYVGTAPMGYYKVVMNYNGDSDENMGKLYGQALITHIQNVEAGYADYFSHPTNFTASYATMMTRVQQIKNQIPPEYQNFLNGLASKFSGGTTNASDDGKLSFDEVFYFSLVGALNRNYQCSAIAVYATASATGKPIIGRLFDWAGDTTTAVFYINKGDRAIMSIGNLLDQAMPTGVNKQGIFIALLDSSTAPSAPFPDLSLDTYYSYSFDLRYALENYSTIEAVAGYMQHNKYTFNHLIVIGDKNIVKVLENDLTGTRALRDAGSELNTGITWGFTDAIGAVNAFLLKGNDDNFSWNVFNTDRWLSINDRMNYYLGADKKITVEEMKKITTFYGINNYKSTDRFIMHSYKGSDSGTQHIVVYDSYTPSLQVFFRNKRAAGTVNDTNYFNVNNPEFLTIPVQF